MIIWIRKEVSRSLQLNNNNEDVMLDGTSIQLKSIFGIQKHYSIARRTININFAEVRANRKWEVVFNGNIL